MKRALTFFIVLSCLWVMASTMAFASQGVNQTGEPPKSAKQLEEINRNILAYETIDRIGAREFKAIMYHVSYPPKDCVRIWAGKRPFGTFVTPKDIVLSLDKELCDDWARELQTWFKSFGYAVSEEVFHAKGLWEYRGTPPINPQVAGHYLAVYQNSLPEGVEACYKMPHTQQQYMPELETITELSRKPTYPYLDQTGTGNSILTFERCVPVPEYLFELAEPVEDVWPVMEPPR